MENTFLDKITTLKHDVSLEKPTMQWLILGTGIIVFAAVVINRVLYKIFQG